MSYIENPKTKGSGIICCIPQSGVCPVGCFDCFFQSGRSYLEPLDKNLPNMPTVEDSLFRVVRVNDGNDSNNDRQKVIGDTAQYQMKFFNTSIPNNLEEFRDPVVLTVNPKDRTDSEPILLDKIPNNLMFVRVRTNTWNLESTVDWAVQHYSDREVPVVLTFMAYFKDEVPEKHKLNYAYRKRTLNSYWAIKTEAWQEIMKRYEFNRWVYSCGKIEGELGTTKCRHCGNCLREYFATMERIIDG